jgi:hypothetical protein
MGPVIPQTIIITQAMIKAAGLPDALVTLVAILSKIKEILLDFSFLDFMVIVLANIRKVQAN